MSNNFTLRTLKNKTEVTYWGVNLAEEIEREQIKSGSVISFKKEGATAVKVPKLDRQGKQIGWTETHRNNWRIENQGSIGIKTKPFPKEIKMVAGGDDLSLPVGIDSNIISVFSTF